jgi:hypothetical protein
MIAFTTIFTFSAAFAGEWVKVIEMGESGLVVEFPMTPEEITAEKARRNNLAANRRSDVAISKKNLKIFEMGEGGHRVVFPMTAAEITAANAENARLAAIRSAGFLKSKKLVVGFELAESGHLIEFPGTIPDKKTDLGDSVIARENPQKNAVRAW